MIYFETGRILKRATFDIDKVLLKVKSNQIWRNAQPGQFVEIRVGNGLDPLLRRPFSVAFTEENSIWLLIQIRGRGSKIIANSDELEIMGPLGNGFPVLDKTVLVGGGSGIAPLIFYFKKYPEKVKEVLFGFKTLPEFNLFELIPSDKLKLITEDGSSEFPGVVTDFIESPNYPHLACGPTPMMKALNKLISSNKLYFSLESYMGCGIGICMGCAVKKADKSGYYRVCSEGPIFRADKILL